MTRSPVLAAVSEVHACAMRLRLAQYMTRDIEARLRAARAVLGDEHALTPALDYFLTVCSGFDGAGDLARQAERLRAAVLDLVSPAPVRRDLGVIYG